MGNTEGRLGNATPTHWWKSPRWTVIRIEALAVVAIVISFLLAVFGSCRRWSNSWIVQKGFFAAQVLSLSLGTYSIGLMQSSSVKSEMYPIWTVSLFTLFGCIDPVTTYNGLAYKSVLSKVVYGVCLNFGYVLLMSISTISSAVGKAAIITLSAITFIKGFHRSFALVQQNEMQDVVDTLSDSIGETCVIRKDVALVGGDKRYRKIVDTDTNLRMGDIEESVRENRDTRLGSCYDVCVALCLSHKLQRHMLGLDYHVPHPETLEGIDFKWALKVIEIELAFVYDAFFTGNSFLHYYQAKNASVWGLASLTGICFVLVATAIPGVMIMSRRSGASGCTIDVGTTTADLAITFSILVSLALLHLIQLVWSWTSNWARAAVACAYAFEDGVKNKWTGLEGPWRHLELSGWMRLKVFVATSTNLFDKYLWQDKISQYSILPEPRLLGGRKVKSVWNSIMETRRQEGLLGSRRRVPLFRTLGLHYIEKVVRELFISDTNKRGGIKLDEEVKGSVIDFFAQIQSDRLDKNWLSSLPEDPKIRHFLPHFSDPGLLLMPEMHCRRYTRCVMTWHIVTWYCELAEKKGKDKAQAPISCGNETADSGKEGGGEEGNRGTKSRDHRRVANALSQYCVSLVKSAPELLPGPVAWTKREYSEFLYESKQIRTEALTWNKDAIVENMLKSEDDVVLEDWHAKDVGNGPKNVKALAKRLIGKDGPADELWMMLARVWVQLLVYAAPYGNVEAHMRRLSQGGEFITHLWALLYHLDIRQWKVVDNLQNITTIEDAWRMFSMEDNGLDDVVVFFASPERLQEYHSDILTASRPIDGVKFYLTSSSDVAEFLDFPAESILQGVDIKFLNNTNKKFTFYGSLERRATYGFALFVYDNKLASAKARAQEIAPSTFQGPVRTENQISEGQTVLDIEEEITPSTS